MANFAYLDKKITTLFGLFKDPKMEENDQKVYMIIIRLLLQEMLLFIKEVYGEEILFKINLEIDQAITSNKIPQDNLHILTYSYIIKTILSGKNSSDILLRLNFRLEQYLINLLIQFENQKRTNFIKKYLISQKQNT